MSWGFTRYLTGIYEDVGEMYGIPYEEYIRGCTGNLRGYTVNVRGFACVGYEGMYWECTEETRMILQSYEESVSR